MNQPQMTIPKIFIRVPKEIILCKDLTEHKISTFVYLNFNQTRNETVHYSPNYMISNSGYIPNWHRSSERNNIYTKFKSCMEWLFANGYILDFNVEEYIGNTFQSSLLNMDKLMPKDNFGIIYDFEVQKIMGYKSPYKPLNKSILLLVLAYLRAFTRKGSKTRPEMFHSQFCEMEKYINVSARMISRATTVLEQLGIIKTHRLPATKKEENWKTDDIVYVFQYKFVFVNNSFQLCNDYDWQKELQSAIKYLHEKRSNK